MVGRILKSADFQRVLTAPQRSRSVHFAIHHVVGVPARARAAEGISGVCTPDVPGLSPDLSTSQDQLVVEPVDDSGLWLGLVVPKRFAKRAVTRNLIKRQVRAAMVRHATHLPSGLWVVRLRAPFDRKQFLSPASEVLRLAAHEELAALFDRAIRSPLPPVPFKPRGRR
jgi:ribonuclease P protein component